MEYSNYKGSENIPSFYDDLYIYGVGMIESKFKIEDFIDERDATGNELGKNYFFTKCIEIVFQKNQEKIFKKRRRQLMSVDQLEDLFERYDFREDVEIINNCVIGGITYPIHAVLYNEKESDYPMKNRQIELDDDFKCSHDIHVLWGNIKWEFSYEDLFYLLRHARKIEDIQKYTNQIIKLIPEYSKTIGYDQNNSYHQYTLDEHSLHVVLNLARDVQGEDMLYLAALVHDIGKLSARCKGKKENDTSSHYYGHPEKSYEYARDVLIPFMEKKGYRFQKNGKAELLYYVRYHDDHISLKMKHLRRHLKMVDFPTFQNLMKLQIADAKAHVMYPNVMERIFICEKWAGDYGRNIYQQLCSMEKIF